MGKYKFSEIKRCCKGNTFEKSLIGKYFCQVFDENGEYVSYLTGDNFNEVVNKQKEFLKGDK